MTSFDRFERGLPELLEELAAPRPPDYLREVLDRTAAARQRPRWTFVGRWIRLPSIAARGLFVPSAALRTIALVVLIVLALIVGTILVVGSRRNALPPPFGPAANGRIAFADASGGIVTKDPESGRTTILVAGPGASRPTYSPDGTSLAYLAAVPGRTGKFNVVVLGADGAHSLTITEAPIAGISYFGWSPDGRSIAVVDGAATLQLLETSRVGASRAVAHSVHVGSDDFNPSIASLFQPPEGGHLLYLSRRSGTPADLQSQMILVVANADGSGERTIIDQSLAAVDYEDLAAPQWSPDGRRIALVITPTGRSNEQRTYVLNADGSGLRPLSRLASSRSDANAAWSPDGTLIAVQRWLNRADGSVDVRPVTVIDVDVGTETEVGLVSVNGYRGWTWSPDGRSIVELSDTGRVVLADAAGSEWHDIPSGVDAAPTWQRLAP